MSRRLIASTGHEVLLRPGEMCVGTDPRAEIPVLPSTGLTSRHFVIHVTRGTCFLRVCPGAVARVNGSPVETAPLHDGALIEAGNLELRFLDSDHPPDSGGIAAGPPPAPAAVAGVAERRTPDVLPIMLIALVFLVAAAWTAWGSFITPVEALAAEDVIVRKGRLFSIQPHRNWLQAHTDMGLDRPVEVSRKICESLFGQSWLCREELCGKDGLPVEIGFDRKEWGQGGETGIFGHSSRLQVVTMQMKGMAGLTLAQHNATLRDTRGTQQLLVLPLFVIGGLAVFVGLEKWRSGRSARSYAAPQSGA